MVGVLFGPPGSGKGTQAELIAPILGVPHISTGDLLRAESEAMSPLGAEVAPLLAAGELVPDELIERVLETLIDRLLRRAHEQHRSDDNPESIAERLAEYHQLTEPVIDYYRGEGVPVFEIDGNGSVEQVHAEIMRALEKVRRS
jgi:adenylate kinase